MATSPARALVRTALAAGALVLFLSFKTPTEELPVVAPPGQPASSNPIGIKSSPTPPLMSGATSSPATSSTPTPPPSSGSAGLHDGTFAGGVVQIPFGPVQVQITVSGGKITDVQTLQMPSDRSRSAQIAAYSAPILRSEALTAQSAQIYIVSGATYTSDGYAQSLQSALDAANHG